MSELQPDGRLIGRLMSLQLRIGDAPVHIADEFPELGVLGPRSIGGTPVVLSLEVDNAEPIFAQAVAAGADRGRGGPALLVMRRYIAHRRPSQEIGSVA